MRSVDFNCDLGEGCADDAAILPSISSASIACGLHAGDPQTMRESIDACIRHGVAIGAHPGYDDRAHFGRREQSLSANALHALVLYQVGALAAIAAAANARLAHVKPHGALYNQAAVDAGVASTVVAAVRSFDPALRLYALAGSVLAQAGRAAGLAVVEEAFAERRYERDGTLTPRSLADASIEDVDIATQQVAGMLQAGCVTARTGEAVAVRADSICLHGDRPDAARFAAGLRRAIESAGFRVAAPGARDAAR